MRIRELYYRGALSEREIEVALRENSEIVVSNWRI